METSQDRQCGRKTMFLTYEEARREAKRMHKLYKKGFTAYACPWCNAFHIGSNRTQEAARRRSARKAAA